MKTLGISELKTHCIRLLKEAHRSREPLVVTLRGKPLVRIEPVVPVPAERRLGALTEVTVVRGDLAETDASDDWESEAG